MTEPDKGQLRALLGSHQWPGVQSQPRLQASCSLISGQQRSGKLRAIMEANALSKFAKENADVTVKYEPFQSVADPSKVRLVMVFLTLLEKITLLDEATWPPGAMGNPLPSRRHTCR